MEYVNIVELVGFIKYKELKLFDDGVLFKAKIAISKIDSDGPYQYIKITAWNSIATALNDVPNNSFVKIYGHIEEKSYDGKCKHCNGFDKKYYTEVIVDNFIVLKGV